MHDLRPAGATDRDGVRDPVPAQWRQPRPGQVPRPHPLLRGVGVRAAVILSIGVIEALVRVRPTFKRRVGRRRNDEFIVDGNTRYWRLPGLTRRANRVALRMSHDRSHALESPRWPHAP